jgi:alpha-N-arabinofuranosidase
MAIGEVKGRTLTADHITAHNTFDAPDRVRPVDSAGAKLGDRELVLTLPPKPVTAVLQPIHA